MPTYKNQNTDLDERIALLEFERDIKLVELKYQLHNTYESVKPLNIVKETVEDFQHSPDAKSHLIKSAVSIAGGYLLKKVLVRNSSSLFKKVLGYALQYGVTNLISKNIKSNS